MVHHTAYCNVLHCSLYEEFNIRFKNPSLSLNPKLLMLAQQMDNVMREEEEVSKKLTAT